MCTLMMIGVKMDGTKALLWVEGGYRESAESWPGAVIARVARDACAAGGGQRAR
jgi:hypothetical protein